MAGSFMRRIAVFMADVTLTVDGKKLTVPAGTLLIEACKSTGIEVPSFCYYPGLSLQGACRMCLVEIEKMPKLQTACTTPVAEGMIVTTESDKIKQARKKDEKFTPRPDHRLLLLIDEFPSLGKMPIFETAFAYIAGYGIKAYLITQYIEQIKDAYVKK